MIKIVQAAESVPGVWKDHTILGQKIRLRIRPRTTEVVHAIREKHKTMEWVEDETGPVPRMAKLPVFDEDAIIEDVIDHMIEDFSGFGDNDRKPLPATKKTKNDICRIIPLDGETSILAFVLDEANKLAIEVQAEEEAEAKNS
jgi:hypothetical protein